MRLRVPVIGLRTWVFSREGGEAESIIRVTDARAAVERALELSKG
jgi:hypothetical protein